MPAELIVCADDFGLNAAVDRGITALAQQGRITALGAMSNLARWPQAAPALADLPSPVQRGLHFNLSEGEPASTALRRVWPRLPGLAELLARAAVGALPRAALADEWQAQLDRFAAATGRPPQFIDGHQHVHALPGVREGALAAARSLGVPVRNSGRVLGPGFAFKRRVIEACGGRALQRAIRAQGIAHARGLVGVYDFNPAADYRALMRAWLAALPAGETALLFCHPALGGPEPGDVIGPAREREAAYLGSAAFAGDLAEFAVTAVETPRPG